MNYDELKRNIADVVKHNGNQEITGQIMQDALFALIENLGAGYQFIGVATPTTNPENPDAKLFYIANGKGTYTNFGGIEVTEDEVVILYYDTEWHKVATGIASQEKLTELGAKVDNLAEDIVSINDTITEILPMVKTTQSLMDLQFVNG